MHVGIGDSPPDDMCWALEEGQGLQAAHVISKDLDRQVT